MKLRAFVIVVCVVFVALIVVAAAVPMVTVAYSVEEPYETTETYYVQEAYTVQETYYEREPYNKQVPVNYLVTRKESYNWFWTVGCDVRVWIRNADTQSGYFTVNFHLVLKGGARTDRTVSQYIALGDTVLVEGKYSGAYLSSFTYDITPPTKIVVDYRDVAKTRDVTKYRDVPKTRTVTKVRTVTRYKNITLFASLAGE